MVHSIPPVPPHQPTRETAAGQSPFLLSGLFRLCRSLPTTQTHLLSAELPALFFLLTQCAS